MKRSLLCGAAALLFGLTTSAYAQTGAGGIGGANVSTGGVNAGSMESANGFNGAADGSIGGVGPNGIGRTGFESGTPNALGPGNPTTNSGEFGAGSPVDGAFDAGRGLTTSENFGSGTPLVDQNIVNGTQDSGVTQRTGTFRPNTGTGSGRGGVAITGGGGLSYGTSTAAEGWYRGQAAVIGAEGSYNSNTAAALVDVQQARSMAISNNNAAVDSYFSARASNRRYREAERGPRATTEELIRYSKEEAPRRLNRYELDPVFGGISWPAVLQRGQFAIARTQIENAFRHRDLRNSAAATEVHVERWTEVMKADLKDMIASINPREYVKAKSFLRSLEHEAGLEPVDDTVAVTNVFLR